MVRSLLERLEKKRQARAKQAQASWNELTSVEPSVLDAVFGDDSDVLDKDGVGVSSAVQELADTLADLLKHFGDATAVRASFLEVAKGFGVSSKALKDLLASLGGDLDGLREVKSVMIHCAIKAIDMTKFFEGNVEDLRQQLRKILKSYALADQQDEPAVDHVSSLRKCLERDLCDRPLEKVRSLSKQIDGLVLSKTSTNGGENSRGLTLPLVGAASRDTGAEVEAQSASPTSTLEQIARLAMPKAVPSNAAERSQKKCVTKVSAASLEEEMSQPPHEPARDTLPDADGATSTQRAAYPDTAIVAPSKKLSLGLESPVRLVANVAADSERFHASSVSPHAQTGNTSSRAIQLLRQGGQLHLPIPGAAKNSRNSMSLLSPICSHRSLGSSPSARSDSSNISLCSGGSSEKELESSRQVRQPSAFAAYLAGDRGKHREKSDHSRYPIRRTVTSALGGGVRSRSWSTTLAKSASEPQLRTQATSSMEALPRSRCSSAASSSRSAQQAQQPCGSSRSASQKSPPAWSITVWANGIADRKSVV